MIDIFWQLELYDAFFSEMQLMSKTTVSTIQERTKENTYSILRKKLFPYFRKEKKSEQSALTPNQLRQRVIFTNVFTEQNYISTKVKVYIL